MTVLAAKMLCSAQSASWLPITRPAVVTSPMNHMATKAAITVCSQIMKQKTASTKDKASKDHIAGSVVTETTTGSTVHCEEMEIS